MEGKIENEEFRIEKAGKIPVKMADFLKGNLPYMVFDRPADPYI
jgi:hypothetical protein